jgi:hypothetical protein
MNKDSRPGIKERTFTFAVEAVRFGDRLDSLLFFRLLFPFYF